MSAKKGTKMAAATELLLVYGLDGSIAVVTGPGEQTHTHVAFSCGIHTFVNQDFCKSAYYHSNNTVCVLPQ